jgi:hypothetical protein
VDGRLWAGENKGWVESPERAVQAAEIENCCIAVVSLLEIFQIYLVLSSVFGCSGVGGQANEE